MRPRPPEQPPRLLSELTCQACLEDACRQAGMFYTRSPFSADHPCPHHASDSLATGDTRPSLDTSPSESRSTGGVPSSRGHLSPSLGRSPSPSLATPLPIETLPTAPLGPLPPRPTPPQTTPPQARWDGPMQSAGDQHRPFPPGLSSPGVIDHPPRLSQPSPRTGHHLPAASHQPDVALLDDSARENVPAWVQSLVDTQRAKVRVGTGTPAPVADDDLTLACRTLLVRSRQLGSQMTEAALALEQAVGRLRPGTQQARLLAAVQITRLLIGLCTRLAQHLAPEGEASER